MMDEVDVKGRFGEEERRDGEEEVISSGLFASSLGRNS
jgi:hypothetical protein